MMMAWVYSVGRIVFGGCLALCIPDRDEQKIGTVYSDTYFSQLSDDVYYRFSVDKWNECALLFENELITITAKRVRLNKKTSGGIDL